LRSVSGSTQRCLQRVGGWLAEARRRAQVVANAVRAVKHLRGLGCEDIEFSPEDAGRSEPGFLYRVLGAVIEAGATTVNIPDTVRGRPRGLADARRSASWRRRPAGTRVRAVSVPDWYTLSQTWPS
jgi:hypothetical protein